MDRITRTSFLIAAAAAGTAAIAVVATAPNGFPTPTDSLWGRQMPGTQAAINLVLIATAAVLASVLISRSVRRRVAVATGVAVVVGVGLYLLSVLAWRLHAPVSAGNGG